MKTFLLCFVSLLVGLVVGYFIEMIHAGGQFASTLSLVKETQLAESGDHAFKAYQHESSPIAVYALTQDLATLQDAEQLVDDPTSSFQMEVHRRMMLDHARLAKLLAASGATDARTNHIAEALKCAQGSGRLSSITNESQLFDIVAKFDSKGVY